MNWQLFIASNNSLWDFDVRCMQKLINLAECNIVAVEYMPNHKRLAGTSARERSTDPTGPEPKKKSCDYNKQNLRLNLPTMLGSFDR
ncbi:hypothetical protein C0J52_14853 [Blattella germanica]|nr:hypothetical protein C0J52_14853 [Blattella germanica]